MALFNIASIYDQKYLNSPFNKELIFTKDKHLITHGVDFLSDYKFGRTYTYTDPVTKEQQTVNNSRGLIPNYDASLTRDGVLGKTGWVTIETSMLPLAANITANDDLSLFTTKQVQSLISQSFAANDAMVFKGVLIKSEVGSQINTYNNVPVDGYSAGWTYRVAEAGDYAGITCEVGDFIIALTDAGSNQTEIRNSHWSVVQTNIVGTAVITINGVDYQFATNKHSGTASTFVAPTTAGTAGQILATDTNKNLVWIDQLDIDAGKLDGKDSTDFVWDVNTTNEGKIQVTKGTNVTTKDIVAAKLVNALTIGDGLRLTDNSTSFDGSAAKEIVLKPATKTTLGGVIIDNTVLNQEDKSTVSVDNTGRLYLTQNNIINALGYKPTAPSDVMEYNIVNKSEDGIVPKLTTSNTTEINEGHYMLAFKGNDTEPSWYRLSSASLNNTWRPVNVDGNAFLNDSSTTLNLVGGDNVSLTPSNGNIIINAVDTTYEKVTATADGLMSKEDFLKLNGIEEGAQKNVAAIASIVTGATSATADSVQDSISFSGENIAIVAGSKNVSFKVNMLQGATASADGVAGLVPAPLIANRGSYLRGDGTWAVPEQRPIKVGSTILNTNGQLEIVGDNDISVTLSANTLTIASTYQPMTYEFGTGLNATVVNNKTTVNLLEATTETIGGIKVAAKRASAVTLNTLSSATDRFYGVEIDNTGKAFVNVPWTDSYNTWRPISINGESIGENSLNIVPVQNSSIGIITNVDANGEQTVGFDLYWFNLDTNEYEKE